MRDGGLPGAYEVTRAEQFGADVVGDDQLTREDAVDDQQADVVGGRAREARHVPRAHGQPVGAHDELALGVLTPVVAQQAAEVGIDVQQADHVGGPGQWDRGSSHGLALPVNVGFQTFLSMPAPRTVTLISGWFSSGAER